MKLVICKKCSYLWFLEEISHELWRLISYYSSIENVLKEPDLEQILAYIQSGEFVEKWEVIETYPKYIISAVEPCCPKCGGDLEETYIFSLN